MTPKSFHGIPVATAVFCYGLLLLVQVVRGSVVFDVNSGLYIETVTTATNPENGNTYHLISGVVDATNPGGGLSWTVANSYAQSLSGPGFSAGLVSINSVSEQEWIMENFLASVPDAGHEVVWIGLNDWDSEGDFVWENGEEVHYVNCVDLLSSGSDDFTYLVNTSMFDPFLPHGCWDTYSDVQLYFGSLPFSAIIEVNAIPEPSTALLIFASALGLIRRRR